MDELLKKYNLKITQQRLDILRVINKLKTDSTIKNIINKTKMDQSTVYRTLKTFEDNNLIDKSIINEEVVYMIKEEHKHYFKCLKCNQVIEIKDCPIDIHGELDGCKIISHSLILDGICNDCNKKQG